MELWAERGLLVLSVLVGNREEKRGRSLLNNRGGILGIRCGEILMISSSTLPWLRRVRAKNVNKLTDFNAAVSSLA